MARIDNDQWNVRVFGTRAAFTAPRATPEPSAVIVYAVVDDALSPDFALGVEREVFIRREDAERFIEEGRGRIPSPRATCGSRSASLRREG